MIYNLSTPCICLLYHAFKIKKIIKENFENISIDIEACDSLVQEELHPVENIFQNKDVEDHATFFSFQIYSISATPNILHKS